MKRPGVGGVGRFFYFIFYFVYETTFSCTLKAIIRGSLCSATDQFPTLFPFFLSPINRGGGHGPIVPPLATQVLIGMESLP